MNKFLIYGTFLAAFIACKDATQKSKSDVNDDLNITDLISSDEYFKPKVKTDAKKKDSIETHWVELGDMDGNGTIDSAKIEYHHEKNLYKLSITCFEGFIYENNSSQISVKNVGDLNNDKINEILVFLQSDESCWDEVRLYSYFELKWLEKYNGLTYQCTENNQYTFRKIDEKTVEFTTFGINKDSIDINTGDTLENIIPNAANIQIINW